jgi:hypothetical protein
MLGGMEESGSPRELILSDECFKQQIFVIRFTKLSRQPLSRVAEKHDSKGSSESNCAKRAEGAAT